MKKLFLFLLAGFPLVLTAQTEPSGKDTLLRFTSFGLADNDGEYLLAVGEKRTLPFTIPNNGFSPPVIAPSGEPPLAIGKMKDTVFQSLADIKLPSTGKHFLVILFPGEKNGVRAHVIRADDPAFRDGNIMIFNLSNLQLAGDLGGEKIRFAPSSQTIFSPKRKDDLANYQVRFYHAMQGEPKLFAASLWPYFEEKRAFVFLYADSTSGSPTYRSIDEFTSWIKPLEEGS